MKRIAWMALFAVMVAGPVQSLRADQVAMQNGDLLNGKVVSVSASALVLQDENFGKVILPRSKVTHIRFGSATVPAKPGSPVGRSALPPAHAGTGLSAALRGIRTHTNLIQQVQMQLLGSAGPAATNEFNQLLDGLSTGKIDLSDLRQQAQSAADQLRSLKKELGPEAGGVADSYLAILNDFLRETTPTNAAASSQRADMPSKPAAGRGQP